MDLYSWINPEARLPAFFVLLALTLIVMVAMVRVGKDLNTTPAPKGIVCLELADKDEAAEIVNSWTGNKRDSAFLSLGLDYLFLFLYPVSISLACNLLAKGFGDGWVRSVGLWISAVSLLAVLLDATENFAIIKMLTHGIFEPWADVSRYSAIPKFAIIAAGLVFTLVASVARLAGWATKES